jgi:hypothetical protein
MNLQHIQELMSFLHFSLWGPFRVLALMWLGWELSDTFNPKKMELFIFETIHQTKIVKFHPE